MFFCISFFLSSLSRFSGQLYLGKKGTDIIDIVFSFLERHLLYVYSDIFRPKKKIWATRLLMTFPFLERHLMHVYSDLFREKKNETFAVPALNIFFSRNAISCIFTAISSEKKTFRRYSSCFPFWERHLHDTVLHLSNKYGSLAANQTKVKQ